MRVCAIDVGTNSVRGLVADVHESRRIQVVHRQGHITRLGEQLSRRGFLNEAAIERTANAVAKIVARARSLLTNRFKLLATSAARNAANADVLKNRIRSLTSLETEIATGVDEAKYVCHGALSSLEMVGNRVLLADIGGGSTELILARRDEEPVLCSVPAGAVYLTERFVRHDPPLDEEISSALAHATATLAKARPSLPSGAEELIGLGGTITTIPPIIMEMESYDPSRVHNYIITIEQVQSILHRLASIPLQDRKKTKGLEPGRADIIIGGLLILKSLLEISGFDRLRVSDRGILFGLALSTARGTLASGHTPTTDGSGK